MVGVVYIHIPVRHDGLGIYILKSAECWVLYPTAVDYMSVISMAVAQVLVCHIMSVNGSWRLEMQGCSSLSSVALRAQRCPRSLPSISSACRLPLTLHNRVSYRFPVVLGPTTHDGE
ncbi:hypothetical protein NDU88_003290 [Pleurodeles waltl]|uniref:Uncharacterized protein n=1 Tax=Pleurodeles waltl TaxID=8319 RepID=A0AAV7TP44_PLEWA|nr:hypothetical protein NDU88_003290 [Pleurodeles waltl]